MKSKTLPPEEYATDYLYWQKRLTDAENSIPIENYRILRRHIKKLIDDDKSQATVINHTSILLKFSDWLAKRNTEYEKVKDISLFIRSPHWKDHTFIQYKYVIEYDFEDYLDTLDVAKSTLELHKMIIRVFLKNKEANPDLAKTIVTKKIYKEISPDELLTDEEVDRMIHCAATPRDKAVIAILADSGCRKGELLSTKIKDAKFDDNGCMLWLRKSKSQTRFVRLTWAASYLRTWLDNHPCRDKLEAPIFCSSREPYNRIAKTPFYHAIDVITEKAGVTKPTNPHNFRHTRATDISKKLKDNYPKFNAVMGWSKTSMMGARYVHLSGTDVDDVYLEVAGVEKQEREKPKERTWRCPFCQNLNPVGEVRCMNPICNRSPDEINEIDDLRRQLAEQKEMYEKAIQNINRQDTIAEIVRIEMAKQQKAAFERYDNPKTPADKGMLEMKIRALQDPKFREEFRQGCGFDIITGEEVK